MKLSSTLVALASLAAVASAQDFGNLPPCAKKCATDSIPKKCGFDIKCICTADSFLEGITCCVAKGCNEEDQKKTIKFANDICGTEGIKDLPQSAVCSSGSATPSATGSSTSSPSGTASPSGSSSSESSSSGSPSSGSSSTGGPTTLSGTRTASPSATPSESDASGSSTAEQTGTATSSASASPSPSKGAGSIQKANSGALAAIVAIGAALV